MFCKNVSYMGFSLQSAKIAETLYVGNARSRTICVHKEITENFTDVDYSHWQL